MVKKLQLLCNFAGLSDWTVGFAAGEENEFDRNACNKIDSVDAEMSTEQQRKQQEQQQQQRSPSDSPGEGLQIQG